MAKKKTKACFNLELIAGLEISSSEGSLLTNILCQNCTDKNKTVVQKILEVRESFELSRKSIEAEKGRTTSVRREYMRDRKSSGQDVLVAFHLYFQNLNCSITCILIISKIPQCNANNFTTTVHSLLYNNIHEKNYSILIC